MERFRNTGQPDWDWWGRLWPTPGETLRRLGLTPGTTLAEVGCGNGYFALPAARIVDPAPVYALDIDEALLEELAAIAAEQRIANLHPTYGDARSLAEYLPEPVEVVVLANTMHGVENTGELLEAISTALRPGGRLVVLNWRALPREETTVAGEPRGPPTELRLSPAETESLADGGAFALIERVDLPPYHYALVFEERRERETGR
jgi:SAM-dependent methyltransferase